MRFCGMELVFTPEAKTVLSEHVRYIQQNPRFFNQMLQRGYQYMPFIEEALQDAGVPEDLKYLAIQESGLRPAVVSSSNAVGFWQFKADAARENGLRVDDKVDERMHIYRASVAAARYLTKSFYDFDNWIYAVIAYYEGPTGAVAHTDPAYFGASSMTVTADLHWYALKWIAHKIAYADGLAQKKRPEVFLMPYSNREEHQIKQLIHQHQVEEAAFFEANPWMLDKKRLPKGEVFTYYVPRSGTLYTGHIPDPNKAPAINPPMPIPQQTEVVTWEPEVENWEPETETLVIDDLLTEPDPESPPHPPVASDPQIAEDLETPPPGSMEPQPATERPPTQPKQAPTVVVQDPKYPPAAPAEQLPASRKVTFDFSDDLHYGLSYIIYDGSKKVVDLAEQYEIRFRHLLMWNGLAPGIEPAPGTILYLTKPQKAEYHVVEEGETLPAIAARHRLGVRKIQKSNRMDRDDYQVFVGQKLYLKGKKPKQEKLIVLSRPIFEQPEPYPTAQNQPVRPRNIPSPQPATESTEEGGARPPLPPTPEPSPQVVPRSRWVMHTVQPGETLWQISQRYETKVAIIKQVNSLESDVIHVGQQLKVRAREDSFSQAE